MADGPFHKGDLQSGIALAVQTQKALLCFVYDDSAASGTWMGILIGTSIQEYAENTTISLRLKAGSEEAGFLSGICPLNSTPAIVIIKNAAVVANLQSAQVSIEQLQSRLSAAFRTISPSAASTAEPPTAPTTAEVEPEETHLGYLDLQPSSGRFRLPNNGYDALREHTQSMVDAGEPPEKIFETQLSLLERLPIFRDEVKRLRSQNGTAPVLSEAAHDRLLRVPAAGIKARTKPPQLSSSTSDQAQTEPTPAPSSTPEQPTTAVPDSESEPARQLPATGSVYNPRADELVRPDNDPDTTAEDRAKARADRKNYLQMQKDRQQTQRDERERIKAQIKADREERRYREQIQKMNETGIDAVEEPGTTVSQPKSRSKDVRLQVRTFDGSTLRKTFPVSASLAGEVRPWIDGSTESSLPYNLKLILTPLPNRNIEAAEEEQTLSDLGIQGSGTLVMVPVKTYVESYTGSTASGLVGSALSGGYNIVTGTAGAVFGGVKSMLGYGEQQEQPETAASAPAADSSSTTSTRSNVRVRTLADQRMEQKRNDQQFYNGNALNFAPNKDEDDDKKVD